MLSFVQFQQRALNMEFAQISGGILGLKIVSGALTIIGGVDRLRFWRDVIKVYIYTAYIYL